MNKFLVLIIIGVSMVLIAAMTFVLVVPYEEHIHYINRQTGEAEYVQKTYGVTKFDGKTKANDYNLSKFGNLTAPDVRILRYTSTVRFPWSESESKEIAPGAQIYQLSLYMFYFQDRESLKRRPVPQHLIDKLMKERVAVWNSERVENDTRALMDYYQEENKRMLPPAVKPTADLNTP